MKVTMIDVRTGAERLKELTLDGWIADTLSRLATSAIQSIWISAGTGDQRCDQCLHISR